MDWKAILLSEQALAVYGTIVLIVWKWMARNFKWDEEKYAGLIANTYLLVEKFCPAGMAKTEYFKVLFSPAFKSAFGRDATAKELADSLLDVAKLAFAQKAVPTFSYVVTDPLLFPTVKKTSAPMVPLPPTVPPVVLPK
jgi:hypothetical protein